MPLLAFALAASLFNASPQSPTQSPTLGKTDAQILAMGRSGWYGYYTKRQGESTAAMCSAENLYGDALGSRNDRRLKALPRATRLRLAALRREIRAFTGAMNVVESARAGGGTLLNLTYSSRYVGGEELFDRLTAKRYGSVKPLVLSDATKPLARLRASWKVEADRPEADREGRRALADADAALRRIATLLKGSPRRESDAVLAYCRRLVLEDNREG